MFRRSTLRTPIFTAILLEGLPSPGEIELGAGVVTFLQLPDRLLEDPAALAVIGE